MRIQLSDYVQSIIQLVTFCMKNRFFPRLTFVFFVFCDSSVGDFLGFFYGGGGGGRGEGVTLKNNFRLQRLRKTLLFFFRKAKGQIGTITSCPQAHHDRSMVIHLLCWGVGGAP